jgi:hypothetical protein
MIKDIHARAETFDTSRCSEATYAVNCNSGQLHVTSPSISPWDVATT